MLCNTIIPRVCNVITKMMCQNKDYAPNHKTVFRAPLEHARLALCVNRIRNRWRLGRCNRSIALRSANSFESPTDQTP